MKPVSAVGAKLGGAREGRSIWLRRVVGRATAASLSVFVVPDLNFAQAFGLDVGAVGLKPVANPRQANVLLLVGNLPQGLAEAAGFVYAQMLRPKAVFMLGGTRSAALPDFDVSEELSQAGLARGARELRRLFASSPWASHVDDYSTAFIDSQTDDQAQQNQSGEGKGEKTREGNSPGPDQDEAQQKPPEGHTGNGRDAVPGEKEAGQGHLHSGMKQNDNSPMNHNASEPESHSPAREMPQHHHSPMNQEAGQGDQTSMAHEDQAIGHTSHEHVDQPKGKGSPQMAQGQSDEMGMAMEGMDHPQADSSGPKGHEYDKSHDQMGMGGGMDHSNMDHNVGHGNGGHSMDMPGMDHSSMSHNMDMSDMDHGQRQMDHDSTSHNMDMPGMDHSSMDHNMGHMDMSMSMSMGGFMSMVEMTKNLPRSRDGLPMEWVEAPFGPLFRGLPGGLMLKFTLDGDVVARADLKSESLKRSLAADWSGPAANFPAKIGQLNPLAPLAYQVLAQKALENASGHTVDEAAGYQRILLLERERMVNHLGLVAGLAYLLGARKLAGSASELQIRLARPLTPTLFKESWSDLSKICRSTSKTPLLKSRLRKVAVLPPQSVKELGGSVAVRANNQAADARSSDPAYLLLGFKPVVREGGDALARFEVYLGELEQSFSLIAAATARLLKEPGQSVPNLFEADEVFGPFATNSVLESKALATSGSVDGHSRPGTATVETPNGPALLSLSLEGEQVKEVKLETPSKRRLPLVGQVAQGQDLADALVGVASLNLSPWELDY